MNFNPPEDPACKPDDAELFDNEFLYEMALGICKDCPIRAWCLEWVDPSNSFFDGVAGGVAWKEGRPLPDFTNIRRDEVLIAYLGRRRQLKKLN
jgi:hypothetical protein